MENNNNNNGGLASSLWNIGRRVVDAVNPFASVSTRLTAAMEREENESEPGTEYDIDSDVHSVLSGTSSAYRSVDTAASTYGSDSDAFVDEVESPSSSSSWSAAATRGTSTTITNTPEYSTSAFTNSSTSATTRFASASPSSTTRTNLDSTLPTSNPSVNAVNHTHSSTTTPIITSSTTYITGTLQAPSPSPTQLPPAPRPPHRQLARSPSSSHSPSSYRYSQSPPRTRRGFGRADTPYPSPRRRRGVSSSSSSWASEGSSEEEEEEDRTSDLERTRERARRARNEAERARVSESEAGFESVLGLRLATYAESATRERGVHGGERFGVVGRFGVNCPEGVEDGELEDEDDQSMNVDEVEEEREGEGEVRVKQESLSPALSMRGFSTTYHAEPHDLDHEQLRMQADLFLNDLLGGSVDNVKAEPFEDQAELQVGVETRLSPIPDLSSALAGLPTTTTTGVAPTTVGWAAAVPHQLVGFVGSSVPAQPVAGPSHIMNTQAGAGASSHRNTQAEEEQPVAGPSHSQDGLAPPRAVDEDWWRSGPCPYPWMSEGEWEAIKLATIELLAMREAPRESSGSNDVREAVWRPVYPDPFLAPLLGHGEEGPSELPESIQQHLLSQPTAPTAHPIGGSAGDLRAVAYGRRVRVPSMEGEREVPWIGDGVPNMSISSGLGSSRRDERRRKGRERREGRASPYASPSPSRSPGVRSRAPSPTARSDRVPTADAPVPVPEAGAESSASTSAVEAPVEGEEVETPSALRRSERISAMVKREREREEREARKERAKAARKAKKDKEVKKDAKATKGKGKGRA